MFHLKENLNRCISRSRILKRRGRWRPHWFFQCWRDRTQLNLLGTGQNPTVLLPVTARGWRVPHKICFYPVPVHGAWFWSRVSAEVIEFWWGHPKWRWTLIQNDWCPYRQRDIWTRKPRHQEKATWGQTPNWAARLPAMGHQAQTSSDCQRLEGVREGPPLVSPERAQTPGPQHWATSDFCRSKPLSSRYLMMAATGS